MDGFAIVLFNKTTEGYRALCNAEGYRALCTAAPFRKESCNQRDLNL